MEKNCFPYMRDLRVIQADSRTRGIAVGPAIWQGRDCRTPGMERNSSVGLAAEIRTSPRNLLYAAGPVPKREAIQT